MGRVRRAFLLIFCVFSQSFAGFFTEKIFFFSVFFPCFSFLSRPPCPRLLRGLLWLLVRGFTISSIAPFAASKSVCERQFAENKVFPLRCFGGVSADRRPSHGGFGRGRTRFIEGFLNFAKRELLLKPRKVCFPALSHPESLIAEVLLSKRINKWVLNLQSVCCLYKSPATCFSVLPRFESLCKGLFSLFIAR